MPRETAVAGAGFPTGGIPVGQARAVRHTRGVGPGVLRAAGTSARRDLPTMAAAQTSRNAPVRGGFDRSGHREARPRSSPRICAATAASRLRPARVPRWSSRERGRRSHCSPAKGRPPRSGRARAVPAHPPHCVPPHRGEVQGRPYWWGRNGHRGIRAPRRTVPSARRRATPWERSPPAVAAGPSRAAARRTSRLPVPRARRTGGPTPAPTRTAPGGTRRCRTRRPRTRTDRPLFCPRYRSPAPGTRAGRQRTDPRSLRSRVTAPLKTFRFVSPAGRAASQPRRSVGRESGGRRWSPPSGPGRSRSPVPAPAGWT